MRVLGKPDLEDSVLLDDLELLLKHYGVESHFDLAVASGRQEDFENVPSAVNSISTEQRTKQSEQQLRKLVDELFEKSSTN